MAQKHRNCVVVAVAYDDSMDTPFVLLREEEEGQIIYIPVGAFEAGSIIMASEGLLPSQPQTHDLLAEFFKRHRFHLDRLIIRGNSISGYFGLIHYHKGFLCHTMDVQPSDGIALALRLDAPIVADLSLMESNTMNFRKVQNLFQTDRILYLDNLYQPTSIHA